MIRLPRYLRSLAMTKQDYDTVSEGGGKGGGDDFDTFFKTVRSITPIPVEVNSVGEVYSGNRRISGVETDNVQTFLARAARAMRVT
jgi:hypothetical protein